jgi:hypothetical protein
VIRRLPFVLYPLSFETNILTASLNMTGSFCALDSSGSSQTAAFFKAVDDSELLSNGLQCSRKFDR